jgi:uncharacterized protein (DUF885 family)
MKLLICLLGGSVLMVLVPMASNAQSSTPPALRRMADEYYRWRNQNYPVSSSDAGLHTWDNKLTDYSPAAIETRRAHVRSVLAQVSTMPGAKWKKDDRIDWLLFRTAIHRPTSTNAPTESSRC